MIFDGITNVMEGDSFPNAALAASGNEPPFALYYDFLFFNQNFMICFWFKFMGYGIMRKILREY